MAEETEQSQKTEAPSQRRLEDARAKGQLAVSLPGFVDLVGYLQNSAPTGAEASANAGIQAYTVKSALVLRKTPAPSAPAVRSFAAGDLVYPTGQKNGIWWEVDDETGNRGWVSSAFITPR